VERHREGGLKANKHEIKRLVFLCVCLCNGGLFVGNGCTQENKEASFCFLVRSTSALPSSWTAGCQCSVGRIRAQAEKYHAVHLRNACFT
jgi:hypothetical protein